MTVKKMKIDRRYWDPAIYDRCGFKRLKRATLADLPRIEQVRWKLLTKHHRKCIPDYQEVFRLLREGPKEAFVPQGRGKRPVRLVYDEQRRTCHEDNSFWDEEEGERHPLIQLAEIGLLVEKENTVTPEKLKIGKMWLKATRQLYDSYARIRLLNRILLCSVEELGILKRTWHPEQLPEKVSLRINGRVYHFNSDSHRAPEHLCDNWPDPGVKIIDVPTFKIDESLVGKAADLVRTRFGEPPLVLKTKKKLRHGNVWVYGSVGVRFDDHFNTVTKVLDSRAVSRLLKQAQ